MTYPGSRWWKFDFHNHTPASSDYYVQEKSIQPREWLLVFMKANIDCVAVTDHNSGEWIDRLNAEYLVMLQNPPEDFRQISIFPGVELTASDGLHIIALFNVQETSGKIHQIKALAKCNDHQNNAESMCSEGAVSICEHIRHLGGVSILAHAEEVNGVFEGSINASTGSFVPKRGSREIDQVLEKCDGIETHDLAHSALQHFADKIIGKALVDGSDAHRLQKAGTRSVWVKMTEPSIEGLRLALLDSESSLIRLDSSSASTPPKAPSKRIVSVSVSQLYRRRQSPLELSFSPWFNSIIGGRGSGKSTVLEILRMGLARDGELAQLGTDSDVYRAFDRFRKVASNPEATGMLRDDTEIIVNVEKIESGVVEAYRFNWKRSGLTVLRREESDEWIDTNISPEQASALFPLKIFSQKQVFEVADRPSALLAYIDAANEVGYEEWSRSNETYKEQLRELRRQERRLKADIERKPPLENELREVARKTAAYQQSTVATQVNVFRQNQADKKSINDFSLKAREALNPIENSIGLGDKFVVLPALLVSEEHPQMLNLKQEAENLKTKLSANFTQLKNIVEEMRINIDNFASSQVVTSVVTKIDESLQSYRTEVERLSAEGVGTAQQAEIALQRKQELEAELSKIAASEIELISIRKKVIKAFIKLKLHRKALTKRRQNFVGGVLANVDDLKIFIEEQSDVDASKEAFRKILRLQDNTFIDEILTEENSTGQRSGLLGKIVSNEIQSPTHSRVTTLKLGLIDGDAEILGQKVNGKLLSATARLSNDDHDSLLEWFPEDKVKVEYRRDSKQKFESLERASAGQKTSAILSFLLAHGDEPLLLDQPEDDLDNALVYALVVRQIRANKSRRQIIVVTHNPNIVVNGDSELVIPMEFKNGEIHSVDAGGLQQRAVREKICAVMEGGKDALRQRYKRILEDMEATK